MTSVNSSFITRLAPRLPENLSLKLYRLRTPAAKTAALYLSPPSADDDSETTVESHFLAVRYQDVLVFALEVLVYFSTKTGNPTIFISKADSSGYLPSSAGSFTPTVPPPEKKSTLRIIATEFTSSVLDAVRNAYPTGKITMALFARSQEQYLFPNSASNRAKHVLTDRALISWWCKVLDPIVQESGSSDGSDRTAEAFLFVPGLDEVDTRRLLPSTVSQQRSAWMNGHPFKLDPENDITVREVIPHFPDDPKARFMDELNTSDDNKTGKRGREWKNINTVDLFWEHMSHRQECALGRCVGFLWVILHPEQNNCVTSNAERQLPFRIAKKFGDCSGFQPAHKDLDSSGNANTSHTNSEERTSSKKRHPEKGLYRPPRKKTRGTYLHDESVRSSVFVVSERRYKRAIDSLLSHCDFGDESKARESTHKWIEGVWASTKVGSAGNKDWGTLVTGSTKIIVTDPLLTRVKNEPMVNILPVRKKPVV